MNEKNTSDNNKVKSSSNTPLDWLSDAAVPLSGFAAGIANLALAADGLPQLRDDKALVASGIFGAIAPAILAIYGNGDKSAEFDRMMEEMRQHFVAGGIDIPEGEFTKRKATGLSAINGFIKEHPVEVSSALAFAGTLSLWAAGYKEFVEEKKITKLITASTTLAGYAIVFGVPEKSPLEPEKTEGELAKMNIFEKIVDKVKTNPMPVFGLLNLGDIGCWSWEAMEDSFKGKVTPDIGIFNKFPTGRDGKIEHLQHAIDGEIINTATGTETKFGLIEQIATKNTQLACLTEDSAKSHSQRSEINNEISSLEGRLSAAQGGIDYLTDESKILFGQTKGELCGNLKLITAAGFTAQILLNFIAHKNKGAEEVQADYDKIFVGTAKMLLQIPEQERQAGLKQMVTFLSCNKTMDNACMEPLEIKAAIEKQVKLLENNGKMANNVANNIVPFVRVDGVVPQGKTMETLNNELVRV